MIGRATAAILRTKPLVIVVEVCKCGGCGRFSSALNRVTSRTLPDGTSETYTPDAATGGQ